MLKSLLIVGCGGFIGTSLRYLTNIAISSIFSGQFPLATFMVNIVGCFVIGMVYGISDRTGLLSANALLLLATGICGGFTTFSAFANEAWLLGSKGEALLSLLYVASSVALGFLCVWVGHAVVKP